MNIPGYSLHRELRQYDDSTTYFATRQRDSRTVALRVVELSDASPDIRTVMRDRLDQIASVSHPNLIELLDFGFVDDALFLVVEWLPRGNLLDQLILGMNVTAVIGLIRQLGSALHALYAHGVVHGDVKPSNILINANGSAVLNVTGLVSGTTRARTTLPGTLGYVSPERIAGQEPTVNSDFYALGVVLFRVLYGDVPWKNPNTGEPRTRQFGDVVPELSAAHRPFEPVLEKLLAFDAQDRLATPADLHTELAKLQVHGELSTVVVKSDLIATAEIDDVLPPLDELQGGRDDAGSVFGGRPLLRYATLAFSTVLVLVILGVGGYGISQLESARTWFAELGFAEHPLLEGARRAANTLGADPNQSLQAIIAAHNRVLDYAPGDPDAIQAIDESRTEWQSAFRSALGANELDVAENRIDELLLSYPNDPVIVSLFDQLQERRRAIRLLEDTQALVSSVGHEDDTTANMAIQAFREVARIYPDSEAAAENLELYATAYAERAIAAAEVGEVQEAIGFLDRSVAANPSFHRLEEVREVINAAASLQAEITAMLQEAGELRSAGALITPLEKNAATLYRRVLSTDPENNLAAQALSEISANIRTQFSELLGEHQFIELNKLLDAAIAVGLDPELISELQLQREAETDRIEQAAAFVADARTQMQKGFITEPVEANAVSSLRSALQLNPRNYDAQALLKECATRLSEVAEDAYSVGFLDDARLYVELALTVTPDSVPLQELRDRWSIIVTGQPTR